MSDHGTIESAPAMALASGNHSEVPGQPAVPPAATGQSAPRRRWRGAAVSFAIVGAGAAGLAAGVAWHGPIAHAMGLHRHSENGAPAAAKQLWTCGMHPQVIQDKPGACPICQMKLEPLDAVKSGNASAAGARGREPRTIAYWWDPMMNPPYVSDRPGKSPMGMDLGPRYEDEVSSGASISIDPVIVQNMGVRIARVTRGPVRQEIRAVGYLQEAQPNVRDVNLRVSGWVEKLHADTVGMALSQFIDGSYS